MSIFPDVSYRTGSGVKIVVLDSGLDSKSKVAKKMSFESGIGFYENDLGQVVQYNGAIDDIGHGTAIASLISLEVPNAQIIPIKIIDKKHNNSIDTMLEALRYVRDHVKCDLINISVGVTCSDKIDELYSLCKSIVNKGIYIVSAFDNSNLDTYPAAFDCVFGVEGDDTIPTLDGYYYDKALNNIKLKNAQKRIEWLDNNMETVYGNSFLAPHVTAALSKLVQFYNVAFTVIKNKLVDSCQKVIKVQRELSTKTLFKIQKAVVFPFNKEVHSLARYKDLLQFDINDFYDVKYTGNVGKTLRELQGIDNQYGQKRIKSIDTLDWEDDFDTIILGHVSQLSNLVGKNYTSYIINNCIKYNKKLVSFSILQDCSSLEMNNISYYFPNVPSLPHNFSTKLHIVSKPVIGIVGTSSKQGKFSIQLEIRRELIKRGYRVGQLGTEPSSALFGIDEVYPMGYERSVYVKGFDAVLSINALMFNIERKKPDLIIFGSQSHCLLRRLEDEFEYTVLNHELFLGAMADAYIMCINANDEIDYIDRIKVYLESLYGAQIICFVISPFIIDTDYTGVERRRRITDSEKKIFIQRLNQIFHIPAISLDDNNLSNYLANVILRIVL